jgi:hypothetical protein
MGGLKIHLDDPSYKASYKAFVSWIEGQVTIDARWRDGFPQAEKLDGRLLR